MQNPEVPDTHHRRCNFGLGEVLNNVRVAGMRAPGKMDGFFVDRCGDNAVNPFFESQLHAPSLCRPGAAAPASRLTVAIFSFRQVHIGEIKKVDSPWRINAIIGIRDFVELGRKATKPQGLFDNARIADYQHPARPFCRAGSIAALTVISGPTPEGSPMVSPRIGRLS